MKRLLPLLTPALVVARVAFWLVGYVVLLVAVAAWYAWRAWHKLRNR